MVDVVWKQFFKLFNRFSLMNVGHHVFQPREDINLVLLAGFNQGEQDAASLSAYIISVK